MGKDKGLGSAQKSSTVRTSVANTRVSWFLTMTTTVFPRLEKISLLMLIASRHRPQCLLLTHHLESTVLAKKQEGGLSLPSSIYMWPKASPPWPQVNEGTASKCLLPVGAGSHRP